MKLFIFVTAIVFAGMSSNAQETPSYQKIAQAEMGNDPSKVEKTTLDESHGAIKKAKVFFISPKDGATVAKKFKVKMGVEGIKIRPAGEAPDEMTSGHHHLIIDGGPTPAGVPVPADAKNIHFGKGEGETELTLPPGDHTLTLQFADGAHRSFGDKMSATIKIKVK